MFQTEPAYFEGFRVPSVTIKIIGKGKDPLTLVERARKLSRQEQYDQVWCVFDRDDAPVERFNQALDLARQMKSGQLIQTRRLNCPSCQFDFIYAIILNMFNAVVVDTSVLISALIAKEGASRTVLRGCLQGKFRPVISNALFLEYEDVAQRPKVIDACPLTDKEIRELLNAFYNVCRWVQIYYLWRPNLVDEGDNFLIELALASNAQAIITHNVKDFQNAELKFPGLSILTPAQLLRGE